MAPRKRAVLRSVKVNDNNYLKNLTLNNVLCPICRNIFIEPVTLPCNHGFCFNCFEGTVANANLTCPLCRVRFGSWHRIAKKDNRIVNLTLWEAVKEAFPDKVKNRLEGIDENLDVDDKPPPIRVASPGAIRREYEAQKMKEDLELKKERDAEAKASEALIKKMKEEEEYEEALRQEKLRFDEEVARRLALEIDAASQNTEKSETPNLESNKNEYCRTLRKRTCNKECTKVIKAEKKVLSNFKKDKKPEKKLQEYFKNPTKEGAICKKDGKTVVDIDYEMNAKFFKPVEPVRTSNKILSPIKVPAIVKKLTVTVVELLQGKNDFKHDKFKSPFACIKPNKAWGCIDILCTDLLRNSPKVSEIPSKPIGDKNHSRYLWKRNYIDIASLLDAKSISDPTSIKNSLNKIKSVNHTSLSTDERDKPVGDKLDNNSKPRGKPYNSNQNKLNNKTDNIDGTNKFQTSRNDKSVVYTKIDTNNDKSISHRNEKLNNIHKFNRFFNTKPDTLIIKKYTKYSSEPLDNINDEKQNKAIDTEDTNNSKIKINKNNEKIAVNEESKLHVDKSYDKYNNQPLDTSNNYKCNNGIVPQIRDFARLQPVASTSKSDQSSPMFYGFAMECEEDKSEQEKRDREFALKLHEELNSNTCRFKVGVNSRKRKRQTTLDELMDPINATK